MLLLRAYHEGGVVNIEISDDGAGMNCEALKRRAVEKELLQAERASQMSDRDARQLIFMPGFSTAAQVTSLSGRGVGMDVVKTNIQMIGGSVDVLDREPCGTTIRIKIPLTLAIIPGLVVSLDPATPKGGREQCFVVPQANLLELVRLEAERDLQLIKDLHGTVIFHHRGRLLPLVYLSRVLGQETDRTVSPRRQDVVNIVVAQADICQIGLVVDHIRDTQEIVVKPLGRQLKSLTCYMGATIMGDGHPALILNVAGLARLAGLGGQPRQAISRLAAGASTELPRETQRLLLFGAGSFGRIAVPLSLVARLEEIVTSRIERAAGRALLHYRGNILPLVCLSSVLEPHRESESLSGETAQVIVFTDGTRRAGVVVDQIVDIVNEAITVRRSTPVPGLLGSAVIGGKITDMLDLNAVVERCGENWLKPVTAGGIGHHLLLLDPSVPSREMISGYLSAFGYEVISANSIADALPKMRKAPIDLVITAVQARGDGGQETLRAIRRDKALERIPVLALMEHDDQMRHHASGGLHFDAQLARSDRGQLMESVAALVRSRTAPREVSA
jgi:two-component system chemotaxis sensor kinase CheA